MRLIIRYIEARETREGLFEGTVATIGRGTDQTIQIPDKRLALAHSRLAVTGGKLSLAAVGNNRFLVNDNAGKRRALIPGDIISLAGHTIRVLDGGEDCDYVVEVELEAEGMEDLRERFNTRLWEIGVPERGFSWVLGISILVIGLVIPASGFILGKDALEIFRKSPLPDDSLWSTGALHQSHAFIGDDCTVCHAQPFVQTRDEECLTCHQLVNHHFDPVQFAGGARVADQCADCHKEHSASNQITRTDQDSCTICHADLDQAGLPSDRLRPVKDFLTEHPGFMVTMLERDAAGAWQPQRYELWAEDLSERSNLIFPHDVHMRDEGVNSPDGRMIMGCSDCHVPEKGGLRMNTVTMEQHCASCHELTFDPATPDRVVPHGSPPDLMRTLREYYAYQFIQRERPEGQQADPLAELDIPEVRQVRRPGRNPRTESIVDLIVESQVGDNQPPGEAANSFIEARVANAASTLFEQQTCTICHDIRKVDDSAVPWQVLPVKLNSDWMPLAEFSHSSHKNMRCEGCHEASTSTDAADVLMPDIGSCRTCHGGEHASNLLQSKCVVCHAFHLDSQVPMAVLESSRP